MIWFRRVLTIPLIFIFVLLFVVTLLVTHVNGTLGSPEYYTDQLRQADVYNFLYDEVVPAALDEVEMDEQDFEIDIPAIKDKAASTVREILPPEWLQAQVESAINTMLPYFVGDSDEFTYTLAAADRVEAAATVLKADTLRSEAFTSLYDDAIAYAAGRVVDNLNKVPYRLVLTEDRIAEALDTVVPEEWAVSQTAEAIDSMVPYLTGDSDHFTITITLRDRVDGAAAAFVELFSGQETYDYLLDEMIAPTVAASVGTIVNLPFGVSLTQEEVSSAVKDVLPQSWVQAHLEEAVDGFAAYVKGEADSIEVVVDLADRKEIALQVLTELADTKLSELFYSLPTCTMTEFLLAVRNLPLGSLPACRPSGIPYEQFKTAIGIDIASTIDLMIGDQIPNQWVYTDADLRASLGEGNEDVLDKARDYVIGGWEYTDADLREDLGPDDEETLNDIREWIHDGYTWTDVDLREEMGESDFEAFDDGRRWAGTVRDWLWALWVLPVLLLIVIGLLGGRNWRNKLAWALAVLFLASLAFFITANVTYDRVGEPELQEALMDLEEYEGLDATMAQKGNEIIENMADGFVSGIESKLIYFMIGSGVVLLGILALGLVRRSQMPGIRPSRGTGSQDYGPIDDDDD